MKKFCTIILLTVLAILTATAQKKDKARVVNDATGTASYTASLNEPIAMARQKCEELAQLDAIEQAFGRAVSSVTNASNIVSGDKVTSTYQENTNADVRGEWIETNKATEFKIEFQDDHYVVTATVYGKIREITEARAELNYSIKDYRGLETTEFTQGQDRKTQRIYVDFQAPVSGNVVIYLLDQTDNKAYQMLPYKRDQRSCFPVVKGETYQFFDPDVDAKASRLNISTKKPVDYFTLCIIFSPNEIVSNFDTLGQKNQLNSMSLPKFQEWLAKARNTDRSMVVKQETITLNNKNAE